MARGPSISVPPLSIFEGRVSLNGQSWSKGFNPPSPSRNPLRVQVRILPRPRLRKLIGLASRVTVSTSVDLPPCRRPGYVVKLAHLLDVETF
jgi:hypothetical protein